ncbi:hypothetical protein [Chryseobacterium wanjuense]|nr:hypothetical protein [Chryseobacterium wanjuense]
MKYTPILILFILLTGTAYSQRPRSLANPEDKKYFLDQLEKIVSNKLSFLKGKVNRNAESFMHHKDTFYLHIPTLPESEEAMLKELEGRGSTFAFLFWNDLLKEFPEFKVFSLSAPCDRGKTVTVDYNYNKDGTLSIFSKLQKRWITLQCSSDK